MAGQGPPPKPADKRRRRNTPATWGDAQPTEVPAAGRQNRVLSIDNPHHLVVGLWEAVQESAEAAFYSEADWARLAMELSARRHRADQPERHQRQLVGGGPARADGAVD